MNALPPIGAIVREARERAGLSIGELAARMGVSKATVHAAESGAQPRASTLDAYLAALPDLTPQALLPPVRDDDPPDAEGTWEHYRRLFGFEAELVAKRMTITDAGDVTTVIEARGLRRFREARGELRLVLGGGRALLQNQVAELLTVDAPSGARLRRRMPAGEVVGEEHLRLPLRDATRGARFARRLWSSGTFKLHHDRAVAAYGEDGPFVEGSSHPIVYPVRVFSLVVRFPKGYRPATVEPFVWPSVKVPDADAPDASDLAHPGGLFVESSRSGQTLRLRVECPLVGFKYGFGWQLS